MSSLPEWLPKPVSTWLEAWVATKKLTETPNVTALFGDGSSRSFYRVVWEGKSRILLWDENWTSTKDYPPHQAYLTQNQIPVPRFYEIDASKGILVMEDLGNELLQERILKMADDRKTWLKTAMELLAQLHGKTFPVPLGIPASSRRFDTQKYLAELKYTNEHLIVGFLHQPTLSAKAFFDLEAFCETISQIEPLVFSHRDYHTRNILIKKEKLYLIDFQDARLGSPHYDIASLLYDPYVPIQESERQALLLNYQNALSQFPMLSEKIDAVNFVANIERVAFQRMLKAAGSFASFFTKNKKETHLPYLVPALETSLLLSKNHPDLDFLVKNHLPINEWIQCLKK